jgi:hypothetical protein
VPDEKQVVRALLLPISGIAFGACCNVFAETLPPTPPFDAMTWTATLERKPSTTLQMGKLRVQLEQTTLDEVRRAASVGTIAHRGDAGDSVYWLCYTDSGRQRIWIMSDGEMGGAGHYVTGVSAEAVPDARATAACPALPRHLQPLSLANHIWLGASEEDAAMHIGAPSFQSGTWRSYDFAGKVAGSCPGGVDLTASLVLHVQNGRATFLRITQTTSC